MYRYLPFATVVSSRDLRLPYASGAAVNVSELEFLADKVSETRSTFAEAKPYAAVRRTEILAWPSALGTKHDYLRGNEKTLQCAFHGVDKADLGFVSAGGEDRDIKYH